MAVGLVPYVWGSVGGIDCWSLPSGVVSAIDLRRFDQIADHASVGYAIAIYPGDLPEGSIPLETGNVTNDRDAWFAATGFRPEGENATDWAFDQLLRGADNAHADAVRPLRCIEPSRWEMFLGGRHERMTGHIDRLRDAVYVRRDLDVIFDEVQAGRLPDGIHRKALQAEADRLGIDPLTLRSKSARWKNETPLKPTTTISDPMNSGSSVSLNTYNGWTTPQSAVPFTTGGGLLSIEGFGTGLSHGGSYAAWASTSMSSSNNQAEFVGANTSGFIAGPMCRGNGTLTGYNVCCYSGNIWLYAMPGITLLASGSKAADPVRMRVQAIGSTIKAADNNSTWNLSVTNTAITTGLRVGAFLFALSTYGGQFVTATDFLGNDFVAPTVTANSASGTFGTGGTVQMSASDSPTSWSLPGTTPTGVSIDNAGLVTWTGSTPAAVHSVTVRATNAYGDGDGTLTLTITSPTTTTTTAATTTTTVPTTTTTAAGSGGPRTTLGSRRFGSQRGLSGN